MAAEWYYDGGSGNRIGPVSSAEVRKLAASGQLQPTALVWREGFDGWIAASRVKGLVFSDIASAAPSEPDREAVPTNAASQGGPQLPQQDVDFDDNALAAKKPFVPATSPVLNSHEPSSSRYPYHHSYLWGLVWVARLVLTIYIIGAISFVAFFILSSGRIDFILITVFLGILSTVSAYGAYCATMVFVESIRVVIDTEDNTRRSAACLQFFCNSPVA